MKRNLISRPITFMLLLIVFPAAAIFTVDDYTQWADENGFGVYWGWRYVPGLGTELVGGMLNGYGQVVEDATFDPGTGEMFDTQVYPQPRDFNDWHDQTFPDSDGGGGGGGGSGSGSGSCLLPNDGCLFRDNRVSEGKEMLNVPVIASVLLMSGIAVPVESELQNPAAIGGASMQSIDSMRAVNGDALVAVRKYLTRLRRESRERYDRFLETAVDSGRRDVVLEQEIHEELHQAPRNGDVQYEELVANARVQCSKYVCKLSYPGASGKEFYHAMSELHDAVLHAGNLDYIGMSASIWQRDTNSVHTFVLRHAFVDLLPDVEKPGGRVAQ